MAPCTLEKTSLTIKPNPFIHPPPILSPHEYPNFVHSLSSTQHHPVTSLGQHACHITTFCMHICIQCSHAHSLATPMLVHLGDACAMSPPFAHAHLHATLLPTFICCICSPVLMHTCKPVSLFIFPFWHSLAGSHIDSCTLGMGSHSTQNVILLLFQEFSCNVCSSILSVWQTSLFVLGST